jgi:hypothetical protein
VFAQYLLEGGGELADEIGGDLLVVLGWYRDLEGVPK